MFHGYELPHFVSIAEEFGRDTPKRYLFESAEVPRPKTPKYELKDPKRTSPKFLCRRVQGYVRTRTRPCQSTSLQD